MFFAVVIHRLFHPIRTLPASGFPPQSLRLSVFSVRQFASRKLMYASDLAAGRKLQSQAYRLGCRYEDS